MRNKTLTVTIFAAALALLSHSANCLANDQDSAARKSDENLLPALNYHLMHPGDRSATGDPNAAFYLDGTYHLHYIMQHPWKGDRSFSFAHVTSPDMLHWTWQKTKLQPAFTGHGMYSGTGFVTKEGRPAVIYHGRGSERNQIAIAKDNRLSAWEKPYPFDIRTETGEQMDVRHWDPDCFLIGDTYYAISGGKDPPLFKSKDLKTWSYVGDFLQRELPGVTLGEDISCANFFPIGEKWMLLCISHPLGCRYYLGDWDPQAEQFVPESHARMNWRRDQQHLEDEHCTDVFAPESVLTPDGRRVMWSWCAFSDLRLQSRMLQTLPRELSLGDDGRLRIRPLRELESLRYEPTIFENVTVEAKHQFYGGTWRKTVKALDGDAYEIKVSVNRQEAMRKRFGVQLFASDDQQGLPIVICPDTGTLRVGPTQVPFSVADLPPGKDLELRIFIDKYLVEVFANDRQAVATYSLDWQKANELKVYTFGASTTFSKVEIWRLKPTNEGFLRAQQSRIYEPSVK